MLFDNKRISLHLLKRSNATKLSNDFNTVDSALPKKMTWSRFLGIWALLKKKNRCRHPPRLASASNWNSNLKFSSAPLVPTILSCFDSSSLSSSSLISADEGFLDPATGKDHFRWIVSATDHLFNHSNIGKGWSIKACLQISVNNFVTTERKECGR